MICCCAFNVASRPKWTASTNKIEYIYFDEVIIITMRFDVRHSGGNDDDAYLVRYHRIGSAVCAGDEHFCGQIMRKMW